MGSQFGRNGYCQPDVPRAGSKEINTAGENVLGHASSWSAEQLDNALKLMQGATHAAQRGKLLETDLRPKPMAVAWDSWDFDIFTVDHCDLPALAYVCLTSHSEVSKFDKEKLWLFVREVGGHYHATRPFHNFRHGVDVLLGVAALLRIVRKDHASFAEDQLVAAILVAALVHDTNHPGCMNSYFIATKHPLASESQTAVLERHHADMALTLLDRPELDFLCGMPGEVRQRFIDHVRELVLATDVTTTMPKAKEFAELVKKGETPAAIQLAALLIKAADISNPARPIKVYKVWVEGVMAEFFAQGDAEKAKGLPFSMNCDRDSVIISKCQVGFISFLVLPLYQILFSYSPGLQPLIDNLEANKKYYAECAEVDAAQRGLH